MANGMYDKGRQSFLEGDIDWLLDNFRMILVHTPTYTVNLATHQFLSSVPAGARIATSVNLASKTSTNGVAGCASVIFSGVTGATVNGILVYKHTGVDATSNLIAWWDTGVTNLPVIDPVTADITVNVSLSDPKLFKL